MGRDEEVGLQGDGPYVYLWPIHVDVWWKPSQYCKVIILQKKTEEKAFDKNDNFKVFLSLNALDLAIGTIKLRNISKH